MIIVARKLFCIVIPLMLIFLLACTPGQDHLSHHQTEGTKVELNYARGFEIWKGNKVTQVLINPGSETDNSFIYTLIPRGSASPENTSADQIIEIPVKNMVVTSTSHIPFLDLLHSSENLAGFPNTKYISSANVRSRIEQGLVKDVGTVNGLDFESLIELQPELVVSYISGPDRSELEQLHQAGIPSVINLDFMETSPLGRAEWIKFMGLLLGKFDMADSVFKEIEGEYLELVSQSKSVIDKPTVFSGIIYGDTWFAPGGNSFVAKFIEDAGGIYTWSDYPEAGSIELSFEAIIDRNSNTDFWIGSGGFTSKTDLQSADPRYASLKAFQTGNVYNYHGRIGATGGFEYLETGGARPDLVLSDFMKILHPQLLSDRQFYFFKNLD